MEPIISCLDCAVDNLLLVCGDCSAKCIIVRSATAMHSCKSQIDSVLIHIKVHIENTFCYKVDRHVPAANAGNLKCVVSPSYGNPSFLKLFAAISQNMALAFRCAFYQLTSGEANSSSAGQEILYILWNREVHYYV